MHHDPSRNVLFIAKEPEFIARSLELKPQEVLQRIESAKHKLLEARKKRKTPFVDKTLYTNWNGMWIQGYLLASRFLKEPALRDFALRTLDRFIENGFEPGAGMVRSLPDDPSKQEGLLEDQVEMLAASVEAFEATADKKYLDFSEKLAGVLLKRFWAEDGGFFDIAEPKEEGHLRFRRRGIQDSPTGSGNATAAASLLKLHHLTGRPEYLERVETLLRFFHEEAKRLSYDAAGYVNVLDFYLKGATRVVVAGRKGDPLFQRLHEAALLSFRPYLVILPLSDELRGRFSDPSVERLDRERESRGRALALVCKGRICGKPRENPDEFAREILENA